MRILINYFVMAGLLVISTSLHAASLSVPNIFSSGTPAIAAEVNSNFTAVKTAVDDNDSRLAALEAAVAALQSTVSSQAGTINALNNDLISANNSIGILQSGMAGKADAGHNHNASYSSISHNHAGVYSPVSHGHAQTDISGLNSSLAGKANTSHSHAQSDVTGLTSSLSTHTSQISAINNSDVMDLDAYLTVSTVG